MQIFTIGHSNHKIEKFIELLKANNIDTIADVRSSPYSKYNPQFNKENLKSELEKYDIKYVFMGKELGARRTEPEVIDRNGKVNFEKVRNLNSFKEGINRLKEGMKKGFRIAIMCSEKEPLECHRFSLISYSLKKEGIKISHILENGSVMDNSEVEKKLLPPIANMFKSSEEEIEEGYKKIEEKISFVREENE
jgi:uncharacterized protein (DUF488 family)